MKRSTTLTALAATAVLAGCGGSSSSSSSSSTVSPATYMKSVCSAIVPFVKDVQSRSSALNPSSFKNAGDAKKALQGFLTAAATDVGHTASQIKAAGTPDVSNGKTVSAKIVSVFTQLQTALSKAATPACRARAARS